jgi:hypothetical protein
MTAILESQGLVKYIDKLYVSCDIGKRKSTGRLFQHVLESELGKLVHIGDNYASDYSMPKKLGIKALWLHNRSEQKRKGKLRKLRERRNKMDYVNDVIKHADDGESALHRIGYEVFGPALTTFIHNVAERARKDDVEMLFFVARDGYVMKKIYEALQHTIYVQSALPPGKYMCLGRLPVRLASLHELSYAQIMDAHAYISRYQGENVSLKDILVSYGLEADGFVDIAKQYGLDLNEPIINPAQDERLYKLLGSNELKEIVRRKSAEGRELLRKYLGGIGFMGKKRVAVVDATAEGLTQTILDMIFSDDVNYPAVRRYYFNLLTLNVGTAVIRPKLSEASGIVSDWRRDSISDRRLFALFGLIIELFSHPNHGVTVGYKEVDGKVVPVFRRTSQETQYEITSQGLQGILSYAKDYGECYALHNYRAEELLQYAKSDVKKWTAYPPIDDVKALRYSFITSDWPRESDSKLIQKIEVGDIIRVGRLRKKLASALWFQGTLALSPISALNCLSYRVRVCRDRFRGVGKIENQGSL